jgi:hypothetical protein
MKSGKRYLSFFFLFLLLFPLAEVGIHDFQHRDDKHCSSTQKHFHKQEHNCSLCDYTFSSSGAFAEYRSDIVLISLPVYYSSITPTGILSPVDYLFSPRAPPLKS